MTHHNLSESTHREIADLIREVLGTGAFVERTTDDEPFVVEAAEIFAGSPGFRISALTDAQAQPVGFVMTVPNEEPDTLEIGPTYVASELRGQGLGKNMVARVIDWAREHGVRRLVIATWGENARARHIFESVGFTFAGEELGARVNGDSTVHFALDLSAQDVRSHA